VQSLICTFSSTSLIASCQWLADGCPDLVNAFSLYEKVEHSYAFLEMFHFYYLEKRGAFDFQKRILQGTTKKLFKTHKTVNAQGKPE